VSTITASESGGSSQKTANQKKMAAVRAAGKAGEKQAGVDPSKPKERIPSETGTAKYRVPDEYDPATGKIAETKNVARFDRITNQIKDLVKFTQKIMGELTLNLRSNTTITPSAQKYLDENDVIIRRPINPIVEEGITPGEIMVPLE
jgi:hypothetical protein